MKKLLFGSLIFSLSLGSSEKYHFFLKDAKNIERLKFINSSNYRIITNEFRKIEEKYFSLLVERQYTNEDSLFYEHPLLTNEMVEGHRSNSGSSMTGKEYLQRQLQQNLYDRGVVPGGSWTNSLKVRSVKYDGR